jgi:WD40 repeat protein
MHPHSESKSTAALCLGCSLTLLWSIGASDFNTLRADPDPANAEANHEPAVFKRSHAANVVASQRRIHQPGGIRALAFSRNGKFLATSGEWRDVFIWKTDDWSLAQALALPSIIRSLVFSPDDRFLYVGGQNDANVESHAVHCRFDWRVGKVDRNYDEQGQDVLQIELSADGRTMISHSLSDPTLRVWDADTGRIVRKIDWRGYRFVYAPTTNRLFLPGIRRQSLLLPLNAPRSSGTRLPGECADAAFTPDERHLLTVGHSLQLRSVDKGYLLVKEQVLADASGHDRLAISPDGRFAALASIDWRVGISTLPDLTPVKKLGAVVSKLVEHDSVPSIVFSPDSKLLLQIEEDCTRPRFLRVPDGEEVVPVEGHGSFVVDLRFSPDVLTLRSVGYDGTICTWDTATMKMLRRTSLPAGHRLVSIRPSDGRYGLRVNVNATKSPGQVFDLETGSVLCNVSLPPSDEGMPWSKNWDVGLTRMFWLTESEALATCDGNWRRFDYRTGRALGSGEIDIEKNNDLFNGCGEPTEDGTRLFYAHDGGKRTPPWTAEETLMPGFERKRLGKIDTKGNPDGPTGLVPGGKYFYIGTQIFDRKSLKRVAMTDSDGGLARISFNTDGSRYIAVIYERHDRSQWPYRSTISEKTPQLVRVRETLSGRTLMAIPFPGLVECAQLSSDGRRVAIALSDGTIEVCRVLK